MDINLTKYRGKSIKRVGGGEFPKGYSNFEPTTEGMRIIIERHLNELIDDYIKSGKTLEEIKQILPDIHVIDEEKIDANSTDDIIESMDGKWNDKKRHYFIVREEADKRDNNIGHRYTILIENKKIYIMDFFNKDKTTDAHGKLVANIKKTLYKKLLLKNGLNLDDKESTLDDKKGRLLNIIQRYAHTNTLRKKIINKIKNNRASIDSIKKTMFEFILRLLKMEIIKINIPKKLTGSLQKNSAACEGFAYLPIFIIERALNFNGLQKGIEEFLGKHGENIIFDLNNDGKPHAKILNNLSEDPFINESLKSKVKIIESFKTVRKQITKFRYSPSLMFNEELGKFDEEQYIEEYKEVSNPGFCGGYVYNQTKEDCKWLKKQMGDFKVERVKYDHILAKLRHENHLEKLLKVAQEKERNRILEEENMARTFIERTYLNAVKCGGITEAEDIRLASEKGICGKFSEYLKNRNKGGNGLMIGERE